MDRGHCANCRCDVELCGLVESVLVDRGVPVTAADEAVDRPLMEVVLDAIDADNELADDAKYLMLAALEGTVQVKDQLDDVGLSQR